MKRWTLVGTAADGFTYQFPINPNDQISPVPNREISWTPTRAGFTGTRAGRGPHPWEFSGVLRSEEQFNAMLSLVGRKDKVRITDDRGDVFLVRLLSFAPEQDAGYRWRTVPYRQTYTMRCLVYEDQHLNEDFELVSHLTVGDTNSFERLAAAKYTGKRGLRMTAASEVDVYRQVTAPMTFKAPVRYSGYLRPQVSGAAAALCFCVPTAVGKLGYQAVIDSDDSRFQLRKDFDFVTPLADAAASVPTLAWYRVVIELRQTSPFIQATLYTATGTQRAQVTSDDTTYTQGRVGVAAFSTSDFDLLKTEPLT